MSDGARIAAGSTDGAVGRGYLDFVADIASHLNLRGGLQDVLLAYEAGGVKRDVEARLDLVGGLRAALGGLSDSVESQSPSGALDPVASKPRGRKPRARATRNAADLPSAVGLTKATGDTDLTRPGSRRDMRRQSFAGQSLDGSDFTSCDCQGADFSDASLVGANFSDAILRDARFTGSSLLRASFRGADLTAAILDRCNLNGIDVRGANLTDTQISVEDLDGLRWDTTTRWSEEMAKQMAALSSETAPGSYVASVPPDAIFQHARRRR